MLYYKFGVRIIIKWVSCIHAIIIVGGMCMYLVKEEYTSQEGLIKHYKEANAGQISYDLRIENVLKVENGNQEKYDSYKLNPGETVFISSVEVIDLPADVIGQVIERYSAIRTGLTIMSPTYIPGHHTKIFTRVTNNSDDIVLLKKEESIVSMMFYRLKQNVTEPYKGAYQEEFEYKKAGIFHTVPTPDVVSIEKKIEDVKTIEKNIYNQIMMLMTIFVAVFSIVNLNVNFIKDDYCLKDLIIYNLVFLGGISTLVTLISCIMCNIKTSVRVMLGTISVALIAAAMFAYNCI